MKNKTHNDYCRGNHNKGKITGPQTQGLFHMEVTCTEGGRGGPHSLPHIGMSLLSAFITMEDMVMVTGMASK